MFRRCQIRLSFAIGSGRSATTRILSVYVDHFRVAGPAQNMEKGRADIKGVLSMDDPAQLRMYLGCGRERSGTTPTVITGASSYTFLSYPVLHE